MQGCDTVHILVVPVFLLRFLKAKQGTLWLASPVELVEDSNLSAITRGFRLVVDLEMREPRAILLLGPA